MVARINTLKSIAKVLNYNEQKLQQGSVTLLHASSFLKDAEDLNFNDKIQHFERLTSLNEKVQTNTLHVSLNFDPSEQLSNEQMIDIASVYMEGIGFDKQPYLVYRHEDAGHPHMHIISTNIRQDGSRISMHNLGRNASEKCRKEIEIQFDLVKASDKALAGASSIAAVDARKVVYGKGATRQAIANVLRTVINGYNFTSLEQLNAILKQYNIVAYKGEPGSRLEKYRGLQYQVLDTQGNRVGVPINSSRFFMKPTLAYLDKRFAENATVKHGFKKRLYTVLDWELHKKPDSLEAIIRAVEKENISVVLRQNKEGFVYGISYIDHKARVIFNGSELGKAYSAKAILEQCQPSAAIKVIEPQQKLPGSIAFNTPKKTAPATSALPNGNNLIDTLIEPELGADFVPHQLKGKKRKKRRKMNG